MRQLPIKLKIYVILIVLLGVVSLYFGFSVWGDTNIVHLIFFTILGIIAESAAIKVTKTLSMSVSFGIGLASILIFHSPIVSLIGFFSMLFAIKLVNGKLSHLLNSELYKRLFNSSAFAISLFMADFSYSLFEPFIKLKFLNYNVISIIAAIIVYAVLNIGIFDILFAIIEEKHLIKVILTNSWLVINIIAIAPLGIFNAIIFDSYGMFAVILFFCPLLLARYSFKLYVDMKSMYSETIYALSNAVDAKDQYTNGHAHRVAEYAVDISKIMKFSEARIDKIKNAAILHDIGKIGIQDTILNKPGKLAEQEFNEIQKHPLIGFNILSQVHNLSEVATIIKYHHERFTGGGYPEGLSGDQVPIESYIISVADAFDAMTSDRPYRKALERQVAIDIILSEKGKQFHPLVVQAFETCINKQKEQADHVN